MTFFEQIEVVAEKTGRDVPDSDHRVNRVAMQFVVEGIASARFGRLDLGHVCFIYQSAKKHPESAILLSFDRKNSAWKHSILRSCVTHNAILPNL